MLSHDFPSDLMQKIYIPYSVDETVIFLSNTYINKYTLPKNKILKFYIYCSQKLVKKAAQFRNEYFINYRNIYIAYFQS